MSGVSGSMSCPNCGQDVDTYSDWRPINTESMECLHCGLYVATMHDYYLLIDLNERRAEQEPPLEPLTELPKQEFRLSDGETQSEERHRWLKHIAAIYARIRADRTDDAMELARQVTSNEERDFAEKEMYEDDQKP